MELTFYMFNIYIKTYAYLSLTYTINIVNYLKYVCFITFSRQDTTTNNITVPKPEKKQKLKKSNN